MEESEAHGVVLLVPHLRMSQLSVEAFELLVGLLPKHWLAVVDAELAPIETSLLLLDEFVDVFEVVLPGVQRIREQHPDPLLCHQVEHVEAIEFGNVFRAGLFGQWVASKKAARSEYILLF